MLWILWRLFLYRFSDFIVNEIDLDGKRIELTDIDEPACDKV